MTNYHHWLLLELYRRMKQVFSKKLFSFLYWFGLLFYWFWWQLSNIISWEQKLTNYKKCFQVNLISCEYDLWNKTRLSEIKISLEKNLTGIECIFFKVSFGNMTRDASFFKDYVDFRANRNDSSRRVYKNKFTATHCYL